MKDIIQELNDYRVPIIKIDAALSNVKYENRFSEKLADANAFLAKAGVPKSFSKFKPVDDKLSHIDFQEKSVRRVFHNDEWWFSVVDVIDTITDSKNPSSYWSMLKSREKDLPLTYQKLPLLAQNNKQYITDFANIEGVLRIIMLIPSPKAEPLKAWLAQLGKETIDDVETPNLSLNRLSDIYNTKGYPVEWIQKRLNGIETRTNLIEQWRTRGVNEGQEFSILTTEISKNTFGLTPQEYAQFKGLDVRQSLRDNMTLTELHFTTLGEQYTLNQILKKNAYGFKENQDAAILGGVLASYELKSIEQKQGIKVVSNQNFMHLSKGATTLMLAQW